jgi:hypothetical protein
MLGNIYPTMQALHPRKQQFIFLEIYTNMNNITTQQVCVLLFTQHCIHWKTGAYYYISAFQWQLTNKWIRRASQSSRNWTIDFSSCTCRTRILSQISLRLCTKVVFLRAAIFGRKLYQPCKYSIGYVWTFTYIGQGTVLQKQLVNAETNKTAAIIVKNCIVSTTLWSHPPDGSLLEFPTVSII